MIVLLLAAKEGVKEKEKPAKQEKKKSTKPKKPKVQPVDDSAPVDVAAAAAVTPKGECCPWGVYSAQFLEFQNFMCMQNVVNNNMLFVHRGQLRNICGAISVTPCVLDYDNRGVSGQKPDKLENFK